jgi:hypothetical protein
VIAFLEYAKEFIIEFLIDPMVWRDKDFVVLSFDE